MSTGEDHKKLASIAIATAANGLDSTQTWETSQGSILALAISLETARDGPEKLKMDALSAAQAAALAKAKCVGGTSNSTEEQGSRSKIAALCKILAIKTQQLCMVEKEILAASASLKLLIPQASPLPAGPLFDRHHQLVISPDISIVP